MAKNEYNNLLKALDDVNKCLCCVECHQLCKNPVTLSKCFHLICSEHFQGLSQCPKCKVSLNDCSTWSDDKLHNAIDAVNNLSEMFGTSKEINHSDSADESPAAKKIKALSDTPLPNTEAPKQAPAATEQTPATPKQTPASSIQNPANKLDIINNSTQSSASNVSKYSKMLEKRNNKGETALHIACRVGNAEKVAKLLSEGAITNTKGNAGWTPLHKAVQNGRLDLVKLLIKHTALVNVPGLANETPLHEAIRFNLIEIAKELVIHGADINARNCKGETPLTIAAVSTRGFIVNLAKSRLFKEQAFDLEIVQRQIDLDFEDVRVYCVSKSRSVNKKLNTLTKHHINLHVEMRFSNKVTHLIVDAKDRICDSSFEVLQGIVNSLWILTTKWVTASTSENLASFEKHEVLGVGKYKERGSKFSRYNKYKLLPRIFNGCHFYFHNFNAKYKVSDEIEVTKAMLTKLVTDGGGVALRRAPNPEAIPEEERLVPYHAKTDELSQCSHYIIYKDAYEPRYNMTHLKALPAAWIIKCIEKYELCEP